MAIRFDLRNLIADELVVPDHALNVATQERWQRPAVTGHHGVEATEQPFPNSLAGEPNAVQSEQPLDPPDNASALLNQVLALALDPLGIFLLDRSECAQSCATAWSPDKPGSQEFVSSPRHQADPSWLGRPRRGLRKLAGSNTIVRMPRAISNRASQNPSYPTS